MSADPVLVRLLQQGGQDAFALIACKWLGSGARGGGWGTGAWFFVHSAAAPRGIRCPAPPRLRAGAPVAPQATRPGSARRTGRRPRR